MRDCRIYIALPFSCGQPIVYAVCTLGIRKIKQSPFSKISRYEWTGPKFMRKLKYSRKQSVTRVSLRSCRVYWGISWCQTSQGNSRTGLYNYDILCNSERYILLTFSYSFVVRELARVFGTICGECVHW